MFLKWAKSDLDGVERRLSVNVLEAISADRPDFVEATRGRADGRSRRGPCGRAASAWAPLRPTAHERRSSFCDQAAMRRDAGCALSAPAQALVGRDEQDAADLDLALGEEQRGRIRRGFAWRGVEDLVQTTRRRRGPARAESCARFIFDDATICMALVIWPVLLTDLIRLRISRSPLGMERGGVQEGRNPRLRP
jgi:hypothetical protein